MRARSHAPRTHFQRSRCGVWAENTAATLNINSPWSAFKISARWATTVQRRHYQALQALAIRPAQAFAGLRWP